MVQVTWLYSTFRVEALEVLRTSFMKVVRALQTLTKLCAHWGTRIARHRWNSYRMCLAQLSLSYLLFWQWFLQDTLRYTKNNMRFADLIATSRNPITSISWALDAAKCLFRKSWLKTLFQQKLSLGFKLECWSSSGTPTMAMLVPSKKQTCAQHDKSPNTVGFHSLFHSLVSAHHFLFQIATSSVRSSII